MTIESVISSTSNDSTTTTTDTSSLLDSDAFLQLLLTEIEYQDPLSPMDSTEYISQLAELSQLEKLTTISEGMDDMIEGMDGLESMSALDYLGKSVEVDGSSIVLSGGEASSVSIDLEEDAAEVTVNIFDSDGNIVESDIYTDVESGSFSYVWDGLDYDDDAMDDGTYTALVSAVDENGDTVSADTTVAGTVTGVEISSDGIILTLDDGRTVNATNVSNITTG